MKERGGFFPHTNANPELPELKVRDRGDIWTPPIRIKTPKMPAHFHFPPRAKREIACAKGNEKCVLHILTPAWTPPPLRSAGHALNVGG